MSDYAHLLRYRTLPWEEFYRQLKRNATADQLQQFPPDMPEIIQKTNLPPLYPHGLGPEDFPDVDRLIRLYLAKLAFI